MTARRDKWSGYTEIKTDDESTYAWSQDKGAWKFVKDHSVYADVKIETIRKRTRDLSGRKKFKVIVKQKVTVTARAGYGVGVQYTSQEMEFYGGEVKTVKMLLGMFESGALFNQVRFDVQIELRKLNATSLQMIVADDVYDYKYDDRSDFENERLRLRKNVELLRRLESQTGVA